jgi:hypothetical protein
MADIITHEFRRHQFVATLKELSKITVSPIEGAVACLTMYVIITQDQHPEISLQKLADNARTMIMSYDVRDVGVQ